MEFQSETRRLEDLINEAADRLRQGLGTLTQWGEQANDILQNKPGALVAGLAVAGFMTGLMMHRREFERNRMRPEFNADPMLVFVTGAIAGLIIGPRFLRETQPISRIK
jgi:hypothetical protein